MGGLQNLSAIVKKYYNKIKNNQKKVKYEKT